MNAKNRAGLEDLRRLLEAGYSGQITLHVGNGTIQHLDLGVHRVAPGELADRLLGLRAERPPVYREGAKRSDPWDPRREKAT